MSTQAHIVNTLGVFNFTHDSALNNTVTKPQETITNIFFCWETDIGMDQRFEGKKCKFCSWRSLSLTVYMQPAIKNSRKTASPCFLSVIPQVHREFFLSYHKTHGNSAMSPCDDKIDLSLWRCVVGSSLKLSPVLSPSAHPLFHI